MIAYPDSATNPFACRRALEALRNGVPNRTAVEMLGCNQPHAERRFAEMLVKAADRDDPPDGALGMLVSGDFGAGKSHLLTHFEHQAIKEGFVCSRVAISKETPLYDLGKVFKSAVDNGQMPRRSGRLIEELGLELPHSPGYADFFLWANRAAEEGSLSPLFPASLLVYERSRDFKLNSEIESFWSGDKIKVSRIKDGLRQVGQSQSFSFRTPKASDLPPQRLRFLTELIKGAGYRGWVVLLDEIELTGQYSLLQRGRSYAEITRWQGQITEQPYPGLVCAGAVTEDFASAIISIDGKNDSDYVGARLSGRYDDLVPYAETGMRLLERECLPLDPLPEADIKKAVSTMRLIYSTAYGWDAPELHERARGAGHQNRMRYQVRAAINQWDLLRLYPNAQPETESDDFRYTYEENPDLERESRDGPGGDVGQQADAPEDDSPF